MLERDAELLGSDLRHRRARAGADVLHRRDHRRAAVGAEPHPRVRGRAAAAVPDLARHPDPALPDGVRPGAHLVPPLPVRLRLAVALLEILGGERRAVVRARVVAAPQLERIDSELRGELVDQALEPERPLDEARRSERLHRRRVELRAVGDGADVLAVVEHPHRPLGRRVPARPADRVRELAVERDDRPVAACAGAKPLDRGVAVARGGVLLAPCECAAHRPPRPLRELGSDVRVLVGAVLRAEAAAHVLADDAHLVLGQPERVGDRLADAPDVLRRDVDVEHVALPLAERLVRLERVVEDGLRAVGALDDDVGAGERFLDVAALVVAGLGGEELAPDGIVGIEHDLELLPLDLDRLDRGARLAEGVRSDGGDGSAREARPPPRARAPRPARSRPARPAARAPVRDRSAAPSRARAASEGRRRGASPGA